MEDLSPCSQGLGRSAVEDRGAVSFLYPISYLLSPARQRPSLRPECLFEEKASGASPWEN